MQILNYTPRINLKKKNQLYFRRSVSQNSNAPTCDYQAAKIFSEE